MPKTTAPDRVARQGVSGRATTNRRADALETIDALLWQIAGRLKAVGALTPDFLAIINDARDRVFDVHQSVQHLDAAHLDAAGDKPMPNSLIDAAEAAVVAHYASQLAGRLDEGAFIDKVKSACDEARKAVRLLLAEGAPAPKADAAPVYRPDAGASASRKQLLRNAEDAWKKPTAGAAREE